MHVSVLQVFTDRTRAVHTFLRHAPKQNFSCPIGEWVHPVLQVVAVGGDPRQEVSTRQQHGTVLGLWLPAFDTRRARGLR